MANDPLFQEQPATTTEFMPVEALEGTTASRSPGPQIEITLENGRKLSVSDDVDAGFVLELARGLAA